MMSLTINGEPVALDAAADTPLLWVLRDYLNLTGTRFGCGMAMCGACTVHIDGNPVRSCLTPVSMALGKSISTIEGMANDPIGQQVQQAWMDEAVAQCGYCQSGQIMSAVALLKTSPNPDDATIDSFMSGNICRCGTYPRIRKAIHRAAGQLNAQQNSLFTEVKA
ncbi:(2Fe-2S)-binding protein [Parathalassolituus penaei]|uniref:(2Fe-2S)-binding protein n=1 Tax=Parathalassolituus penaei TaxID=2997323 RepID=A0A9X3IQC0_9GAMM|nr:(2Fe-2S)-binding protein [Parathalassolituus penaei]MCY0964012.1 (2Fe-2S)-binding protein [Parathalassolituus penaei]